MKIKRKFFFVFKKENKKRVMLKLEENGRMRKWRKSENEESDYVQMNIYKERGKKV